MDGKSLPRSSLPNRPAAVGATRWVPKGGAPIAGTVNRQARENVKCDANQKVVYFVSNPICRAGGVVERYGSTAPEGAIAKVASMTTLRTKGPARCCNRARASNAAIEAGTCIERDSMSIAATHGELECAMSQQDLDRRPNSWTWPVNPDQSGVVRIDTDQMDLSAIGAVIRAGGKAHRVS